MSPTSYYRRIGRRPFSEMDFDQYVREQKREIEGTIRDYEEAYILSVDEAKLIDHLESTYIIDLPEIHFDAVHAESFEEEIPAELFPQTYFVRDGESYPKSVIYYHIPVSGATDMLRYYTSTRTISGMGGSADLSLLPNEILIRVISFNDNPEDIKKEYETAVNYINLDYPRIRSAVAGFNDMLKLIIKEQIASRKQSVHKKSDLLSSLNVPVKKQESVPTTFSIPQPIMRQKISVKPVVYKAGFKPEPTLDVESYKYILQYIQDMGKNLERYPSLYKDKGEEALRDNFLLILDPSASMGSASGETFNKSGKTDIQLRHDSGIVFVAECKFWTGAKGYLATIDQLLGYLTWRENKTAVIMFVKQKDITGILGKIKEETVKHSNYLGTLDDSDENWFNYRFHINGDPDREVRLAVMIYHLPDEA